MTVKRIIAGLGSLALLGALAACETSPSNSDVQQAFRPGHGSGRSGREHEQLRNFSYDNGYVYVQDHTQPVQSVLLELLPKRPPSVFADA